MNLTFWKSPGPQQQANHWTNQELLMSYDRKCAEVNNILTILKETKKLGYELRSIEKTIDNLTVFICAIGWESRANRYEIWLYIPSIQTTALFQLAGRFRSTQQYQILSIDTFAIDDCFSHLGLQAIGFQYLVDFAKETNNHLLVLDITRINIPNFKKYTLETLTRLGFKICYLALHSVLAERRDNRVGECSSGTLQANPTSIALPSPYPAQDTLARQKKFVIHLLKRRPRKFTSKLS